MHAGEVHIGSIAEVGAPLLSQHSCCWASCCPDNVPAAVQEQWNTIQTLLPMRVFIQLPHDILTLMSSDPAVAAEVLISLREENPEAPVGRIVQKA